MLAVKVKQIPVSIDLETLSCSDENIITSSLKEEATHSIQLLIDALFTQPRAGTLIPLPKSLSKLLPRSLKCPQKKATTRWEKFAKEKGIKSTKRQRVEYDDQAGDYRVKYGYDKHAKPDLKDWVEEVDDESTSVKSKQVKESNLKKNEMQQRRNIEEAEAAKMNKNHKFYKSSSASKSTFTKNPKSTKDTKIVSKDGKKDFVKRQILETKTSTASLGKFDEKLKGDVKLRVGRKVVPMSLKDEKAAQIDIIAKISKGKAAELITRKAIKTLKSPSLKV